MPVPPGLLGDDIPDVHQPAAEVEESGIVRTTLVDRHGGGHLDSRPSRPIDDRPETTEGLGGKPCAERRAWGEHYDQDPGLEEGLGHPVRWKPDGGAGPGGRDIEIDRTPDVRREGNIGADPDRSERDLEHPNDLNGRLPFRGFLLGAVDQ